MAGKMFLEHPLNLLGNEPAARKFKVIHKALAEEVE